jgi:DNA transformation protein
MAPRGIGSELAAYLVELLAPLGGIGARRFFGGVGLVQDAVLFAMIMDETLYFRVDDAGRARYEAAGSSAFSYGTKTGTRTIAGFFTVPDAVLDEPEDLRQWARGAIAVAAAAKAKRRPARRQG